MTDYTGSTNIYNSWKADLGNAANLNTDTFKMLLCTSSYTPSAAHATLSDITNECSGNGYARQTIDATYSQTGGTGTFDFADPVFTASGGSIVARYWVQQIANVLVSFIGG